MKTITTLMGTILVMLFTPLTARAQTFAYVANSNSNSVSVIDISTNAVVATVPVGIEPVGVAITPDGTRVYVANEGPNTSPRVGGSVSVIDTSTNAVVATVPVGGTALGVAVTPDGTRAYVTNPTSGSISVIDTSTNAVVATVPLGGAPYGVAITPDGTRAYVGNQTSASIQVINTSTNTLTATVFACFGAGGVAISPDGARAYVANFGCPGVEVIDTSTNTVVNESVFTGGSPFQVAVTPDGSRVYVPTQISVAVVNTSTNTVVATVPVAAYGVAVTPDGTRAYVTGGSVSVIDTSTNTVVATVAVGSGPHGVAITPLRAAPSTTTLSSSSNPSEIGVSVTLTATVTPSSGTGTPTGTVTFTDTSTSTTLGTQPLSSGQATLTTSSLAVGTHNITAQYSGDSNFQASSGSLTQTVEYGLCLLYDQTMAVHSGAVIPIKLELCDANGNDLSTSAIIVHATGVVLVSTNTPGTLASPGNANPDNDFRFDSTLGSGGGYIFNLSTGGLGTGTYNLQFTAGSDPVTHAAQFEVK